MADLTKIIFNQFIEILAGLGAETCCCFDECDFDYRLREVCAQKSLDIKYTRKDHCCREHTSVTSLDITNICLEDLTSCEWGQYVEGVAKDFIDVVCPKNFVLIKNENKGCRKPPAVWSPSPCHNTTTVVRKCEPIQHCEKVQVVYQQDCECIEQCVREPCRASNKIIVKLDKPCKPWACGDCTHLVHEKHDGPFRTKPCCQSCSSC